MAVANWGWRGVTEAATGYATYQTQQGTCLVNGQLHSFTFYNNWGYQNQRCVSTGNCRSVNDPTAPLADQAAAVMGGSSTRRTLWGFFVPNDFIRFRVEQAWDIDIYKSMILAVEQDRWTRILVN